MGLLACALLGACHKAQDPRALFQSVSSDYQHGDLELARQRATRAREDFSAGHSQSGSAWGFQFRLLEAEILLRQTNSREALALLTGPGSSGPREGELAIRYNLIRGLAHAHLGDLTKGDQELSEARRLAEELHSPQIADVLRTEGLVALDAGRTDQADEKFRNSLVVARRSGDAFLQAFDLVDLGEDSLENGHFDQALILLQASAEIAQSVQARRQFQLATGNMGWAYYNLGDFERALAQFQQAEQLAQRIGMTRNRTMWLQDAGLADYKLGNLDAARKYEEQALQSLATLADGSGVDQVTNIETNLALLLYEQGQYPAAQGHLDKAAMQARSSKDQHVVAYVGFVQGLVAERVGGADPEQILLATRRIATDQDVQTDIEAALANLYATRGQSEKARLWYRQAIGTFEAKRSAESDEALRLAAFGFGAGVYREYADFLVNLGRPDEALRVLDGSRARTLDEGLGLSGNEGHTLDKDVVDPGAVARTLKATILFYSLGPEQSYLWAVTGRESRLFMLPAAKDIQSQVEAYQKAILKSDDPIRGATPAAASLYATLIKPAAALVPAGSRVFLVPDGILHTLNFETLVESTEAGARYWIEDVTVTSASSIRMLAHLKGPARTPTARQLLLIGNPVVGASGFDALPNAANEIQRIQQHFASGTQTVLTQGQAVPSAYTQSGPDQYRYIHFVAHGTASRLSPLDSAVVLSPPPGRPDDFKLYARDILQHPLHAELVTISTCYGSGVRAYAGEGLVGLAWVFLRAGSHNVIGALWQADDSSTPLLMDQLYAELQSGKTPDVALRNAKLSLIHSSSVYRKPFYWAPFQLYSGS
jgi:CHAT domain-containing protein/Tfp pilus assembly protein PilF